MVKAMDEGLEETTAQEAVNRREKRMQELKLAEAK